MSLKRNEPTIADAFERINDGIVAFDAQMNYTYVNKRGGELLGRKPEDLVGKNYWKEYPEAKGTPFGEAYMRALETQQPVVFEDYYAPWNRWFENRIYPSQDGLTIFFTETTERKRAEQLLKMELRVLEMISSGSPLPGILETIVLNIEAVSRETIASILLLDPDGIHVRYGAAPHLPDGYNRAIEGEPIGPQAGSCGTAMYYRKPIVVTDIETDPLWDNYRDIARQYGLRACWSTPVIGADGTVLASFAMYYREPRKPEKEDFALIERATHMTQIAIERKQAQEALRASEEKFRNVFESANVGKSITLPSGEIFVNKAFADWLGYSQEELVKKTWQELTPPEEIESIQAILTLLLKGERDSARFEKRYVCKNGSFVWADVCTVLHRDTKDRPLYFITTLVDITQRKRAEEQLRLSEKRFSDAFHTCPAAITITRTSDGKFIEVNEAYLNLFEFSREQVIGHLSTELNILSPEERAKIIQQQIEAGGLRNAELVTRSKSGRLIHLLYSSAPIEMDGETCFITTMLDITAQKRAEAELRLSEERFSKSFYTGPAGMTITRIADGKFIDANDSFCQMFEFSREEVIGRTSIELKMWTPEERNQLIKKQIEAEGLQNFELQARSKSGKLINILFSSKPMEIEDEVYLITIMIDITERKTAEQKIKNQLERISALHTIDSVIASSFDLKYTVKVISDHATSLLNVDAAAVLLFNPFTNELEFAAGKGFRTTAIHTLRIKLGQKYSGQAALERRTIIVPDVAQDEQFQQSGFIAGEDFVAFFAVPLITKGRLKGVMEVFHRAPFNPDSEWLDFLHTLAGQTAIAIENAQLLEELQQFNIELLLAYDTTIEGWSRALDLRDKETEGHTLRVTELTLKLARAARMNEEELVHVRRGALLHDIGKLGIPDTILLKPDTLTEEEWAVMRQHPTYAYELLSPIPYLRPALDIPYCHHEKWDGSGYPRGLKGEQIPLAARLFAVVDVWDALRSDRPYRQGWTKEKVIEHIKSLSGTHFDPKALDLFLKMMNEDDKDSL